MSSPSAEQMLVLRVPRPAFTVSAGLICVLVTFAGLEGFAALSQEASDPMTILIRNVILTSQSLHAKTPCVYVCVQSSRIIRHDAY